MILYLCKCIESILFIILLVKLLSNGFEITLEKKM